MKAAFGFVSLTEVSAGEHRSYNQWHLFDHLPEQLPLPGVLWGQRWVLTPRLRSYRVARPPLDRIHYATLYLLAEPIEQTLAEFRARARQLRAAHRFHLHRISHLSGAMAVESWVAAAGVRISAEALPFRPNTGAHVRLGPVTEQPDVSLRAAAGVAGVWTFTGLAPMSPPALRSLRMTWCWLDGDPVAVADASGRGSRAAVLHATFAAIDPQGPWDWFDAE